LEEGVGAALRQFNTLGSFFSQVPGRPAIGQRLNPDFDAFEHIPKQYQPTDLSRKYWNADSVEQVNAITRQIEMEQKDRQTLHEMGGTGFALSVGAGLVDPVMILVIVISIFLVKFFRKNKIRKRKIRKFLLTTLIGQLF
jgi:hypothetical protein